MSIFIDSYINKKKMKEEEKFIVRCYGKSELANLYFPNLRPEIASQKLKRWIRKCKALFEELTKEEFGYRVTDKNYTAREVKLIVYYLGEPFI